MNIIKGLDVNTQKLGNKFKKKKKILMFKLKGIIEFA